MHPIARSGGSAIPCAGHQQDNQPATVGGTAAAPVLVAGILAALILLSVVKPTGANALPASPEVCQFKEVTSTQAEPASATVVDVTARSLATVNDEWEVVTFVYLRALGGTRHTRFRVTQLPQKGQLLDFRANKWCRVPSLYVTESSRYLRHGLRYVPYPNHVGQDTFKFRAVDANSRESTDAVATVSIERLGLRWQLTTYGSTGFSAEAPSPEEAKAIGSNTQNAMFRLDWQWITSRTKATLKPTRLHIAGGRHWGPRSFHATVLSGFGQRPLAAMTASNGAAGLHMDADDLDPETVSMVSQGAEGDSPGATLAYQPAFTVGTEMHVGWVGDLDAQGTYAEYGPVAGAYFDTFISQKSVIENGIPMVIQPRENVRSHFRFEYGFRIAFKEMGSDLPTGALRRGAAAGHEGHDAEVKLQPGNPSDLFVFDLLYQRSDALNGLVPAQPRDSGRRWAFRLMATPSFPGRSDTKFLLGIEVSRDLEHRGPRDVRLFYGAGLSR